MNGNRNTTGRKEVHTNHLRIKGNLLIIFNDTDRRPFLMGKSRTKQARNFEQINVDGVLRKTWAFNFIAAA